MRCLWRGYLLCDGVSKIPHQYHLQRRTRNARPSWLRLWRTSERKNKRGWAMESPDDVHYLKLEVLWHADSANGFDLTFFDKDAERAERAIEQFVHETIHDISKLGAKLYHSIMLKFARRSRWASVFEKEIATINVAAMIQSGTVIENDYNRITRWQRPLSNFAIDPVNDETKSLVKTTSIKIAQALLATKPESRAVKSVVF